MQREAHKPKIKKAAFEHRQKDICCTRTHTQIKILCQESSILHTSCWILKDTYIDDSVVLLYQLHNNNKILTFPGICILYRYNKDIL